MDLERFCRAVVDEFLTLEKPTPEQLGLLEALDRIAESYSESELRSVLFEHLGAYYDAVAPETFASWLAEIAAQLRQVALEG